MQTHVLFIILSLVLLWFNTTTATSVGHQLIAAVGGAANTCIDKERQALLDFKAQLQDPDGQLSTWKDEEDCCNWRGVTCDSPLGHVTGIRLFFNNFSSTTLTGEFSPSLLNLSYLNHLDLYNNFFHGTIPNVIGSMTQLTYLDLGWNQFTGNIPRFIGNLTQLTYLNLGSNQFTGTIPMSIGFLTKLTFLDLSQNSFSGTIPPNFGNLTNLLQLKLGLLGRCSIENLDWLSSLSHLYNLILDGNSLAKANYWVNAIIALRKLSSLSLVGCDLSQVTHPYYSSPKSSSSSIATLYIDNNNLNSTMYHWLCPLVGTKLEVLSLMHNKLSGKLSNLLSSLSGSSVTIQVLHATDNQLTGSLSDAIRNFSSLKDLDLSYNWLNGTISEKVWELPQLQELNVSSNPSLKLQEVNPSKSLEVVHTSNISCVENVDLSSCNLGPLFPKFIQAQKNLTVLTIAYNSIADTIPVEFWSMWPSRLTYLDVSSNKVRGSIPDLSSNFAHHSLIDAIFENIGKSNLSYIDLSNNSLDGVPFTSKPYMSNLSNVDYIDLSTCKLGPVFPKWIQTLKNLTQLNIAKTRISDTIPLEFWNSWPSRLTYLNLSSNNITGEVKDLLSNFDLHSSIDLSSNNFSGPILNVSTTLETLDLSGNKFSGGITFLCQIVGGFLTFLDLSDNSFRGYIPDCLWHFKRLKVLNFGHNSLFGRLPASIESLI
nr:hypothetical protein [Tanacetum cinerariifolium]